MIIRTDSVRPNAVKRHGRSMLFVKEIRIMLFVKNIMHRINTSIYVHTYWFSETIDGFLFLKILVAIFWRFFSRQKIATSSVAFFCFLVFELMLQQAVVVASATNNCVALSSQRCIDYCIKYRKNNRKLFFHLVCRIVVWFNNVLVYMHTITYMQPNVVFTDVEWRRSFSRYDILRFHDDVLWPCCGKTLDSRFVVFKNISTHVMCSLIILMA